MRLILGGLLTLLILTAIGGWLGSESGQEATINTAESVMEVGSEITNTATEIRDNLTDAAVDLRQGQ